MAFHAKCEDDADQQLHESTDAGLDDPDHEVAGEVLELGGAPRLSFDQLRSLHNLVDTDQDGKASMLEFTNYAAKMRKLQATKESDAIIEEIDTDKNGKLSMYELIDEISRDNQQASGKKASALSELERQKFKVADINGDGFLTKDEIPTMFFPETHAGVLELAVQHTLSQRDKNNDEQLSESEFWQGEREGEEGMPISDDEHRDFEKLDTNGDGLLSIHELKAWETGTFQINDALKILFQAADKDGDKHLSAEELAVAREYISMTDANYHFMDWVEHSEL